MRLRKPFLQLLVYLLPALTVLIAYSAYHETLFRKPSCQFNCETLGTVPNPTRPIQNTLDLIDELVRYKTDLMRQAGALLGTDLTFLQTRLNLLNNDYDAITRYGDGFLQHNWARLNAEMNAKIEDYLNQHQTSYFLTEALQALSSNKKSIPNAHQRNERTNLASSSLPLTEGLIPRALANDILSPGNNYLIAPSNLTAGRSDSGPTAPPISGVPIPGAAYLLLSALAMLGLLKYLPLSAINTNLTRVNQ